MSYDGMSWYFWLYWKTIGTFIPRCRLCRDLIFRFGMLIGHVARNCSYKPLAWFVAAEDVYWNLQSKLPCFSKSVVRGPFHHIISLLQYNPIYIISQTITVDRRFLWYVVVGDERNHRRNPSSRLSHSTHCARFIPAKTLAPDMIVLNLPNGTIDYLDCRQEEYR